MREPVQYTPNEATPDGIALVAGLAAAAFEPYRQCSGAEKAMLLEAVATGIDAAKEGLVATAMRETHLAQTRLEGEVSRTVNQLKLFASLLRDGSWVNAIIDTALPERKPLPKPDIRQMQVPLGPVAVFCASNFPFAFSVAGGDTASALAAGCPVICKAHPGHPETAEKVAAVIAEAVAGCNLPAGIFTLLHASDHTVSSAIVSHPLIRAVGFTGSLRAGKALFDAAAKRAEPIPVYAEMGSINPVFLLPGIVEQQPEMLAEKLALSNLLSTGQFCTNPGVIILVKGAYTDHFLGHFARHIEQADAGQMLTAQICSGYKAGIQTLKEKQTVRAFASGKQATAPGSTSAYMFTVSAKDFLSDPQLQHEVFGPGSIHVIAEDANEMYLVATALEGQLTCSIWGTEAELEQYAQLTQLLTLKAGRIIFNNVPTGVEVTHAMVHGGPYPATTDSRSTSVGTNAIYRFTRAVCYQNCPQALLPDALKNENPLQLWRMVNGRYSNAAIPSLI